MRRRLIALGLVVLAVGLAAAYWFTQVPDEVAEDHRDRALPEHAKVERAMDAAAVTLNPLTFSGGDFRAANRTRDPRRFLRRYRRESRKRRRRLRPAGRAIEDARRTLRAVDRDRLLEVRSKPLLGGSEPVKDAEAIAEGERAYLRASSEALDEYERVVRYAARVGRVQDRVAGVLARGFAEVPNRTVTDPAQLTRPLDRLARRLRPFRRAYLRLDAPPELRRERRLLAGAITVTAQEVRRASAAFSRFDNAGAQRAQRRLNRRLRRLDRRNRGVLSLVVERSAARRKLEAADRRAARLRRAYEAL